MEFYRELFEIVSDYIDEGIHVIDRDGKTVIYNNAMEGLEGLRGSEVRGKNILEVFPSLNENTSTLCKVLKTGEPIFDRYQTYVNKGGYSITAVNTTIPIIKKGEILGALEISKDFTRIKELYDKIINLYEKTSRNTIQERGTSFDDIIGCSNNFTKAVETAKKAAASSSTVLIFGETGTGKEVFSKCIHYNGRRKDKPFIAVNCAALPEGLLEGILFGTTKGGFTGAVNRPGLFEQASGGTLLLDEINSMSTVLQAKLLRVLQEGYVRRIGDIKDISVDVRIIATTNENPKEAISKGVLRKDLFYRLSVINITIPSLNTRKDDIPLLAKEFIEYYNIKLSKNVRDMQNEVFDSLMSYDWPGNVRELKNYIEGAMNMVSGHVLKREHFTPQVQDILFAEDKEVSFAPSVEYSYEVPLDEYMDDLERKIIMKTLLNCRNNISEAARSLKIKRQTLQHKIRKYNIEV